MKNRRLIAVPYHYIPDHTRKQNISFHQIATAHSVANTLTEPLGKTKVSRSNAVLKVTRNHFTDH